MRFIMPAILIGIAVAVFFMYTDPTYKEISKQKALIASYNEALNNSKALENEKDKLTAKENAISKDDLAKLQRFLPDNVDNIRLILEIEKIGAPYNMALKDIKYSSTADDPSKAAASPAPIAGGALPASSGSYGTWNLEFSTSGSYDNFMSFLKALESNLRIVDVSSIEFSSSDSGPNSTAQAYKYNFKIKTYWLKN